MTDPEVLVVVLVDGEAIVYRSHAGAAHRFSTTEVAPTFTPDDAITLALGVHALVGGRRPIPSTPPRAPSGVVAPARPDDGRAPTRDEFEQWMAAQGAMAFTPADAMAHFDGLDRVQATSRLNHAEQTGRLIRVDRGKYRFAESVARAPSTTAAATRAFAEAAKAAPAAPRKPGRPKGSKNKGGTTSLRPGSASSHDVLTYIREVYGAGEVFTTTDIREAFPSLEGNEPANRVQHLRNTGKIRDVAPGQYVLTLGAPASELFEHPAPDDHRNGEAGQRGEKVDAGH